MSRVPGVITKRELQATIEKYRVGPNSPLRDLVKARKKRDNPEERAQVALITEIDRIYPPPHPISRIFAIPNDAIGANNKAQQARKKAMGLRAGSLDLCLPLARAGWFGLYVELKMYPNRLTAKQKERIRELESEGYHVAAIRAKTPDELVMIALGYIVGYESQRWTQPRNIVTRSAAEYYVGINNNPRRLE